MTELKQYREKAGFTQKGLGLACGWPKGQSRIAKYESGDRQPSLEDMRSILAVLSRAGVECSLDDVFPPKSGEAA